MWLLVFSYLVIDSFGARWPRFRGPDGAGQSEDSSIPPVWREGDYLWRVTLPGVGQSSPVVWEDLVFVTSSEQSTGTRIVRAIRGSSGEVFWETRFESPSFDRGRSISYDTASPAADKDRVYLTYGSPEGYQVVALDQSSGKELWRHRLGSYKAQHGSGASPIRFQDLLIVPNDQSGPSSLVALDCESGRVRWKVERRSVKTAYSTPIIYRTESGGPELIVASTAHGVSSFDPANGALNWELADLFGTIRVVGSPVVAGGLIFTQCGSGGGGKGMFAVRPPNATTGGPEVAYELKGSLPYVPTPVAHGKLLFLLTDNGVVSCIDSSTGERVWRERVGGNYFASPVRVADRIYCVSREGVVVVLAAGPEYRLLGRVELGESSHSTPAVSGGVMYLRTFSHLMAISGDSGNSE